MSDPQPQPAAEAPLTQWQRVVKTFSAPSKTFQDIRRGNATWWLPFLITLLFGTFLWYTVGQQVTWQGVYDNNQRMLPAWAQRMEANMSPEQKAQQEKRGPISQKITWAIAPLGLLLIDVIAAAVLLGTINFGFGGKAKFGQVLAVTFYSGLVLWPLRLLLGAIALWAGALPDAFSPQNPAGTNLGYYLSMQDTPRVLYVLATRLDVLVIWCLVLTSIGLATVAGVKRSSGYIAVFGWWGLFVLLMLAGAAFMG